MATASARDLLFDRQIYRQRNLVERCFNRLKGFRGIATRHEKTATAYEAAVTLASFPLRARSIEDGPWSHGDASSRHT